MDWLAPVLHWLGSHPHAAGLIVALIAFGESLALVGLFVPGAVLMFGTGALIGTGYLAFWPIAVWAFAGAVLGDGVSFWLGRRYGDHLRDLWPLRRYPAAYDHGVAFFRRHGGKSVLLGRFFGPIRPIIPAVAGVMGMSAGRFLTANLLSALVWAPAYLFPGMVFAASLTVAAAVTARLIMLLLALVGAGWLFWWLAGRARMRLGRTGARLAGGLPRDADVLHPLSTALRALKSRAGVAWWLAAGVFSATLIAVLIHPPPADWERAVLAFLDAHRAPWLRLTFWCVTQLGGTPVVIVAGLALTAPIFRWGGWVPALTFSATVAAGLAVTYALKALIAVPRPDGVMGEIVSTYSFPSAHAAGIAVLCFAVATLVAPPMRPWRRRVFTTAAAISAAVAVSRVVLGVHWPMDVIGGLALGGMIGAAPALLRRTRLERAGRRRLAVLAPLTLAVSAAAIGAIDWRTELAHYPLRQQAVVVDVAAWWRDGAGVAVGRHGFGGGEKRFDVQWLSSGDSMLEAILRRTGWRQPAPWGLEGALRWLAPDPDPARLPVLPRWHAGLLPELVRIRPLDERGRLVLRAWPAARTPGGGAIWLVSLEQARLSEAWPIADIDARPAPTRMVTSWLRRWAETAGLRLQPGSPPRLAPATRLPESVSSAGGEDGGLSVRANMGLWLSVPLMNKVGFAVRPFSPLLHWRIRRVHLGTRCRSRWPARILGRLHRPLPEPYVAGVPAGDAGHLRHAQAGLQRARGGHRARRRQLRHGSGGAAVRHRPQVPGDS